VNLKLNYLGLFVAVLLVFLGTVGCAPSLAPVVWQDPHIEWLYPAPPQQPRIKFLRQIGGLTDLRGEQDRGQRFLSWLGGEESVEVPLVSPYAVTADGDGRIWMTDPGVSLLYLIDIARQRIEYFSVFAGQQLQTPTGVVFDAARQRLFIANAGTKEVLVLDDKHNYLLSLAPPGGFGRPGGLALDQAGNLYVADVLKGMVEVFSSGGRHLKSLGSLLSVDGKFNHPSNVAVDAAGRIYVVDSFNFRVEILGLAGEAPSALGGLGDSAGSFARPRGISVDSQGHIYVADAAFDNIQVFHRNGDLLLVFGRPGKDSADTFCMPAGLAFDAADRLYVADSCAHQVKIFQFFAD
jgi:DNA-binding beta-propeller fold protein YncE